MHAIGQRTYKPTDWKSVNLSQVHQKHTVVKTALGNFQQASLAMWTIVCRTENRTQHSSLENNIWKHKGKFIDADLSNNILDHIKTLQTTETHKSNGMRLSASPLQIRWLSEYRSSLLNRRTSSWTMYLLGVNFFKWTWIT